MEEVNLFCPQCLKVSQQFIKHNDEKQVVKCKNCKQSHFIKVYVVRSKRSKLIKDSVVYPREGDPGNKHIHSLITKIALSTDQSDGSEVTSVTLPGFPGGLFVAMSEDKTFQYYRWLDIAEAGGLRVNTGEIR